MKNKRAINPLDDFIDETSDIFDETLGGRLTDEDRTRVAEAVAKVENTVNIEIVPVLVYSSTPIPHHLFALIALFLELLLIAIKPFLDSLYGNSRWTFILGSLLVLGGSKLLSRSSKVQRFFALRNKDQDIFVRRRAILEFLMNRVGEAKSHNGIILFVSYVERKAVVYTDPVLTEKIRSLYSNKDGSKTNEVFNPWKKILSDLTDELKKDRISHGFEKAILTTGELLASILPRTGQYGIEAKGQNPRIEVDNHKEISVSQGTDSYGAQTVIKSSINELPNDLIVKF